MKKPINLFELWPAAGRLFVALFFLTSAYMKLTNSFFFARTAPLDSDWGYWLDRGFTLSWYRPVLEFFMPYADIVAVGVILLHAAAGALLFLNVRVRLAGFLLLFMQLNILFGTMNGWGFLVMVGSSLWIAAYYAAGPPCSERVWRWLMWAFIGLDGLMIYGRYVRGDLWVSFFPSHFANFTTDVMGAHPVVKSWVIALSSGEAGPWIWASTWWIHVVILLLLLTRFRLAAGILLLTLFMGRAMLWMNVMGAEATMYVLLAFVWLAEEFRQQRLQPPASLWKIFSDVRLLITSVRRFFSARRHRAPHKKILKKTKRGAKRKS